MLSRVRVVIVNYNAGALLLSCVRRVMQSSILPNVIVVDNGSTDGSLDLLRSAAIEGVTLVENGQNLGFAKANNRALRDWIEEYALLLNPDALVQPNTLERLIAALDERLDAGMAGCLILNEDGSEQAGCRRLVPTPMRVLNGLLGGQGFNLVGMPLPAGVTTVEAISGACMLVRRSAIEAVGLLDEGYFMHCEDLDWCMRFRQSGLAVLFVPDGTITHIKGHCSQGDNAAVEWFKHRGMIRYYSKFFRGRYPWPLLWGVYGMILLRYGWLRISKWFQ